MKVDQRSSATLRNRRLFKMKREVSKRLQAARDMYAIGKHPMELESMVKYETVLARLQEIRESMTAPAPKQWKDLSPTPEEIEARLPALLERLAQEAAQRVAKAKAAAEFRDKTFEQMGVDPHRIPTQEKIKQTMQYVSKVKTESTRAAADKFLGTFKKNGSA